MELCIDAVCGLRCAAVLVDGLVEREHNPVDIRLFLPSPHVQAKRASVDHRARGRRRSAPTGVSVTVITSPWVRKLPRVRAVTL